MFQLIRSLRTILESLALEEISDVILFGGFESGNLESPAWGLYIVPVSLVEQRVFDRIHLSRLPADQMVRSIAPVLRLIGLQRLKEIRPLMANQIAKRRMAALTRASIILALMNP